MSNPLVALDAEGKATILSYNVPEPTSYVGRHAIALTVPTSYFSSSQRRRRKPDRLRQLDHDGVRRLVTDAYDRGALPGEVFGAAARRAVAVRYSDNPGHRISFPGTNELSGLSPEVLAARFVAGQVPILYKNIHGALGYRFVARLDRPKPQLFLIEKYRLSSFLGSYGAGRVLKSFSLLPGEETKLSVKSYTRRESTMKSASSIFDSFTESSATEFEDMIEDERTTTDAEQEALAWSVSGSAEASWGFGSAEIAASAGGSTNASREEFSKNISKASHRHAMSSSAKRDVQIDTSHEVNEIAEEEQALERSIKNINVSRTLNFVFRQMNQEYVSLLHLIDVRVAYTDGMGSHEEVALHDLDALLGRVITRSKRRTVRQSILGELELVLDHAGKAQPIVEQAEVRDAKDRIRYRYPRVRRDLTSTFEDPATGASFVVPGVIMNVDKFVMRTEGVIVESLLGQANALDGYSRGLQEEAVRAQALANELRAEQVATEKLRRRIVEQGDDAAVARFERVFGSVGRDDHEHDNG